MSYEVVQTEVFERWLASVRDRRALAAIGSRIDRLEDGYFGDHKSVGDGVSEMRINVGKGYRLYYTLRGNTVVILISGGDKSSQSRDVRRAKRIAMEV